jgi:integrase
MTRLRKMMLDELQRRNYSDSTARGYLSAVAAFAQYFGKPPDQLGPDDLRRYQAYLLKKRKLGVNTVIARVAALRFFFVRTLKRHEFRQDLPYPKKQRRLPTVLSLEEVGQLIDAAGNLQQRAVLMILYGTGMRRAEVSRLKVTDVDSRRMLIRVECGKGGHDRDVPLSPALLETLREYWRWKKPRSYLFPSDHGHRGKDQPMSDKSVWYACTEAARYAGLRKRVTPHTLRHYVPSRIMSGAGRDREELARDSGAPGDGGPDFARHSFEVYRPLRNSRRRSPGLKRPGLPFSDDALASALSLIAIVASR